MNNKAFLGLHLRYKEYEQPVDFSLTAIRRAFKPFRKDPNKIEPPTWEERNRVRLMKKKLEKANESDNKK